MLLATYLLFHMYSAKAESKMQVYGCSPMNRIEHIASASIFGVVFTKLMHFILWKMFAISFYVAAFCSKVYGCEYSICLLLETCRIF